MLISVVMMREWSIISIVVAELPPARNGGKDRNPTCKETNIYERNLSHIAFTSARYLHQCAGRLTIVDGEPHFRFALISRPSWAACIWPRWAKSCPSSAVNS
jgi:hypothetical protein